MPEDPTGYVKLTSILGTSEDGGSKLVTLGKLKGKFVVQRFDVMQLVTREECSKRELAEKRLLELARECGLLIGKE